MPSTPHAVGRPLAAAALQRPTQILDHFDRVPNLCDTLKSQATMHDDHCATAVDYLLCHSYTRRCYIGATVDCVRRLRQHNREIAGGARATGPAMCAHGGEWRLLARIEGLGTFRNALRFEWALKHACRRRGWGAPARIDALGDLLRQQRWTRACDPAHTFQLYVAFADDDDRTRCRAPAHVSCGLLVPAPSSEDAERA